jgi:formyltetrahydrofolate-dependent phosphoribosylglycinamide formyltransferase
MAVRIGVLASGGGTTLQAIIDYLAARKSTTIAQIAVVAANRETAGALERARAASIPAETFNAADDGSSLLDTLRRHDVDLVVLAGYMKKIPPSVIQAYHRRMINIHPGLLPDFGGPGMYGAKVHAAVLSAGARTTGVTVHFVDDEYDHGPTIAQWRIAVREDDTPETLGARVLEVEHQVYPRTVEMVAALNNMNFFADL